MMAPPVIPGSQQPFRAGLGWSWRAASLSAFLLGLPLVAWPVARRRQGGPQLALPRCPQGTRPLPACGRRLQSLQPLAAVCVQEHQACQLSWAPRGGPEGCHLAPKCLSEASALVKRPPVESIHSDPRDPLF